MYRPLCSATIRSFTICHESFRLSGVITYTLVKVTGYDIIHRKISNWMTSGYITIPDVRQPRLEYRRTYQCELTQTKEVTLCVQGTKLGSATLKAFSAILWRTSLSPLTVKRNHLIWNWTFCCAARRTTITIREALAGFKRLVEAECGLMPGLTSVYMLRHRNTRQALEHARIIQPQSPQQ